MDTSKNSHNRGTKVLGLKRIIMGKQNKIRVVIRRRNISSPGPSGPLERSIDDPKLISPLVHLWHDSQQSRRSIFDRQGVVVNQHQLDEDRLKLPRSSTLSRSISPASHRKRSRSNSPKKRSNPSRDRNNSSREKSNSSRGQSNSPIRRCNSSRGKSTERRSPYRKKSPDRRSSERIRRSRSLDIRKNIDKFRESSGSSERITGPSERKREKKSDSMYYRKKSISPLKPGEYIPYHPDLKNRYRLKEEQNKYSRSSRSISRDRYKASTSTRRSVSPYRHKPRRVSRSRSPRKQSQSPSRKHYKSRSPKNYSEDKRNQRNKRNSRSPHDRSPVKYIRRSRSPSSRHGEHRSESDSKSRRSRSLHPPNVTFSPSRSRNHRPRSRSPNERNRRYRESRRDYRRSRSHSPRRRTRSRSPMEQYKGIYPGFGYYEGIHGPEFWTQFPGPMRPSYPAIPPRFYPPPYYPRSVAPGPIILPPRYPMLFPPTRPRIIYNNRKIKTVSQSNEMENVSREQPARVSKSSTTPAITEISNDSVTKEDVDKEETKD